MLSKSLAAAVIGAALIATPVLAQNTATNAQATNAQSASAAGLWQGSKLVSMNVYNGQGEKIGTIKDLMLNKDGKIESVVIGVGGFLGVGERDVAIKFSEIKWSNEPVKSASSGTQTTTGAGSSTASPTGSSAGPRTYPDHAIFNASKDQLQAMPQFDYNK